jgi:peroxiredoxin (alkyl hydroperoxide reductase subunit C)
MDLAVTSTEEKGGGDMSNHYGFTVGDMVPDFKIETFDPAKGDFGEISLADLKANKKWAILFFYPADFTFV